MDFDGRQITEIVKVMKINTLNRKIKDYSYSIREYSMETGNTGGVRGGISYNIMGNYLQKVGNGYKRSCRGKGFNIYYQKRQRTKLLRTICTIYHQRSQPSLWLL